MLTRSNVIAFLESLRKTETLDPMHRWIGTYNLFRIYLLRFFKWLYYPDIEPDKRPKPSIVENLARLKRKEKSIYKPSDLWTQQDDLLFLKYCPSKRDNCYHVMSRDLSCRPHEILYRRRLNKNWQKSSFMISVLSLGPTCGFMVLSLGLVYNTRISPIQK